MIKMIIKKIITLCAISFTLILINQYSYASTDQFCTLLDKKCNAAPVVKSTQRDNYFHIIDAVGVSILSFPTLTGNYCSSYATGTQTFCITSGQDYGKVFEVLNWIDSGDFVIDAQAGRKSSKAPEESLQNFIPNGSIIRLDKDDPGHFNTLNFSFFGTLGFNYKNIPYHIDTFAIGQGEYNSMNPWTVGCPNGITATKPVGEEDKSTLTCEFYDINGERSGEITFYNADEEDLKVYSINLA